MSREIKFRAYDYEKKRMEFNVTPDPSRFAHLWVDCGISGEHRDGSDERYSDLMQFTGLKDKNGKEIYEGDILKSTPGWATFFIDDKREHISVVEFVGSGFKGNYSGTLYNLDRLDMAYTEVIGNIYENPELLETK